MQRRSTNVGSRPLVRVRKIGASLLTRRAYFQRGDRTAHVDDDDAIQNDAPAASVEVDLILSLRQIGLFVETAAQQSFVLHNSPHSLRGPPAIA